MDAYESRKREWEDLNITKEELKNLTECMKKEEFRKLLVEYAEEVTDPENRKIYEQEITQLEKQRGIDVTFVNPEPGYVIKTSLNGEKKCFLNISKSEIVKRPTSQPLYEDGHRGLKWRIPCTVIPPRDDLDKKNVRCMVFDVVFHPDTIYLASKNARFRDIVNKTAMDGVENNFKVKLDRKNLKFPKMKYKGVSHPSVIRKPSKEPPKEPLDIDPEIYQKLMSSYDESREQHFERKVEKPQRPPPKTTYYEDSKPKVEDSEYVVPNFVMHHQMEVDMQDYTYVWGRVMNTALPKNLVIIIDLPLLSKATDASLDVKQRYLYLKSEKPAKYSLEVSLMYNVDADLGTAKFDTKYKKLTVVLPVIRKPVTLENITQNNGSVDNDVNVDSSLQSVSCKTSEKLSDTESTDNDAWKHNEEMNLSLLKLACLMGAQIPVPTKPCMPPPETVETPNDTEIHSFNSLKTADPFMNPDVKYTLPSFACNIYDNQLAFTLNVKNVNPNSIKFRMLENNVGVHVLFESVGAGYFPQHYSFCFKLEEDSIDPDSVAIEPWTNNVICSISLSNIDNVSCYLVGLNEEFMERKDLPTSLSFNNRLNNLTAEEKNSDVPIHDVKVEKEDNSVIINIHPNRLDSDEEQEENNRQNTFQNRKTISKSRSISESSGDELPSSSGSIGTSKGILKSHRSQDLSRSVSESSEDDNGVTVSSADLSYGSAHDHHSESECCSLKKTVRFNNVVSRQLFRSNSSILGQRKKNQRKLRNKKRAHERKLSESENSETEERDKYKISSKATPETETLENVKPILNREKHTREQKSNNIKIEQLKESKRLLSEKRKSSIEEESAEDVKLTNIPNTDQAEFKSDLIFDLDM